MTRERETRKESPQKSAKKLKLRRETIKDLTASKKAGDAIKGGGCTNEDTGCGIRTLR